MLVLFCVSVLFILLIVSSPLFYMVILLIVSLLLVYTLVVYSALSGLLGLLILLVYYGAILILISYVCSVSPNVNYDLFGFYSPVFWFRFALSVVPIATLFFWPSDFSFALSCPSVASLVSYFYSYLGAPSLIFICVVILIVLLFCSFYTYLSSPFRSS